MEVVDAAAINLRSWAHRWTFRNKKVAMGNGGAYKKLSWDPFTDHGREE